MISAQVADAPRTVPPHVVKLDVNHADHFKPRIAVAIQALPAKAGTLISSDGKNNTEKLST
jgi:hypothetical protein